MSPLASLLGRMIKVSTKIVDNVEDNVSLYRREAKVLRNYQNKLQLKNEITTLNAKMSQTVDEIISTYTGDGNYHKKIKQEVDDFKEKINNISMNDEDALEILKNIRLKKIEESKNFQDNMQKNIVAECNKVLIMLSNEKNKNYSCLEPDFTLKLMRK